MNWQFQASKLLCDYTVDFLASKHMDMNLIDIFLNAYPKAALGRVRPGNFKKYPWGNLAASEKSGKAHLILIYFWETLGT